MIEKFADEEKLEMLEKREKLKTKVLKYIMFKKRTEKEVREKFANEEEESLEEVIEILKDLGYINDVDYIDRFINEAINIKNLSLYELRYKLYSKGISKDLIENYFSSNYETLVDYEKKSALNIVNKKKKSMEIEDIKLYLRKKGYKEESIRIGE